MKKRLISIMYFVAFVCIIGLVALMQLAYMDWVQGLN